MTQPTNIGGNAQVVVLPSVESAAKWAADAILKSAVESIDLRGRFSIALAGGTTPRLTYERLASESGDGRIDWGKVRVFFTDERCVAADDDASNFRMVNESLLSRVGVDEQNVFPMTGVLGAGPGGDLYQQVLLDLFPNEGDRLDFVLLGMGADGHTASLFPETEALAIDDVRAAGNYLDDRDGEERVTMTFPFLNASRRIVFLVTGEGKADALRAVLTGPADVNTLPATGIVPADGTIEWVVDEAAAATLPDKLKGGS
jgi:6-phosphogluconolactonase